MEEPVQQQQDYVLENQQLSYLLEVISHTGGKCVYRLGVGPKPILRKNLTVERLSHALREVISNKEMNKRAKTMGMEGIPVYSIPGVGGGFEIMQQYKIDKKVFSTADLSTILMGLSNLSTMIRGDELVNALAKVKSFIPADRKILK